MTHSRDKKTNRPTVANTTTSQPEQAVPGSEWYLTFIKRGLRACLFGVILSGLGSILLLLGPALVRETETARRVACENRLRRIALAVRQYRDIFGTWPPRFTVDSQGKPLHSWRVLILPYLDEASSLRLYRGIRLNEPWDSRYNRRFHNMMPSIYRCPSLGKQGTKPNGRQDRNPGTNEDYPDRTCSYFLVASEKTESESSNRILVVERRESVNWMCPNKEMEPDSLGINRNEHDLGSFHPGGMNVAMTDGSVRFLNEAIAPDVLEALLFGTNSDSSSKSKKNHCQ